MKRYTELAKKGPKNRTTEENKEFRALCDVLFEKILEENKAVFLRLKDR